MKQFRRYSVLGGAFFAVAIRWSDRVIALLSTVILARLLTPEDFGIIAIAALIISLADVLLDLGVNVALIRDQNVTQAHYDTAWTLRLLQTSLATIALMLLAPVAADYFHDERLKPVIQVLAFSLLLSGLENIGIVVFQKQMQFGAEFRFLFIRRVTGFLVAIPIAFLLQTYWALVIGALAGRAIGVPLSYLLHPMRPKLSLDKFQDIFRVSQWILVRSMGSYLQVNLHKILVGRWSTTSTMGAYAVADEISALPSGELLAPLNRVLFPAFSRVQHNVEELKRLFILAQALQTLIAIPAAAGLALVADQAIQVILGDQWRIAAPFVQVLALVGIAQALVTSSGYLLIVLGKIRDLVLLTWTQVMLFVACAFLLLPTQEAQAIAWLRLLVAAAGILLTFWLLLRAFPILRLQDIFVASVRPLIGAGAMAVVLTFLTFPAGIPIAALLVLKIALGASSYIATILVLWWFSGRPNGAESYLVEMAIPVLARFRWGRRSRD